MKKHIKAILLGYTGVGKTSFVTSANGLSIDEIKSSTGANYSVFSFDDPEYDMQLWDTAGQEKFQSQVALYYRNSYIVFFVTACRLEGEDENVEETNDKNLVTHINNIKEVLSYDDIIPIFILNKIDAYKENPYSDEECEVLKEREEHVKQLIIDARPEFKDKLHFYSVSCKFHYNVNETLEEAFNLAVEQIKKSNKQVTSDPQTTPEINNQDPQNKKCSC